MFRFPHLGTPQSTIRVPHNESQMIHPTQQLSGSALTRALTGIFRSISARQRSETPRYPVWLVLKVGVCSGGRLRR
jgi:hypothetical protein